jgi:hypothetical protein
MPADPACPFQPVEEMAAVDHARFKKEMDEYRQGSVAQK